MWIEQAPAGGTTKKSSRVHGAWVGEGVTLGELLLDRPTTPLALELPVERLKCYPFRVEFILVALDSCPDVFRIHRYDRRHEKSVERQMDSSK